jgi:hypothetical protein
MTQKVGLSLAVVAILFAIVALLSKSTIDFDNQNFKKSESDIELHVSMAYLQRYMDKLYFAGKANNKQLINYYIHELEEILEEIAEEDPTYDEIALGKLALQYGVTALENLEDKLLSGDSAKFATAYTLLMGACNGCHKSSNKGFIIIKKPTSPAFTNQDFSVQ